VAGAWRTYEFNVTDVAKPGQPNVLAVETWAPTETDLAITFVDWNPAPPDKEMGLWRDVYFTTSAPVAIRYPTVLTHFDSPSNDPAHLTVTALLKNGGNQPVKGSLKGKIENIEFAQDVELAAGESKDVTFEPDKFPQLNLANPRLWWPAQMGTPNLYSLNLEFDVDHKTSDKSDTRFGIREVTSELTDKGHRLFRVNGRPILIRGGGWASDMMLRRSRERLRAEMRYVREMGLNTVRSEGKFESDEFFDLAVDVIAGLFRLHICLPYEPSPTSKRLLVQVSMMA